MKSLLLLFIVSFLTLSAFSQDNDGATKMDYQGHTLLKGLVIDLGTAYFPETSGDAGIPDDLFNVKTGRPSTVNIYLFKPFKLIQRYLVVSPGIGVGLDNYYFEEPLRIVPATNTLVYYLDPIVEKSKIAASHLDIPVEFLISTSPNYKKAFKIGFGGKVGVLFSGKAKVKTDFNNEEVKIKYNNIGLDRFRYGLTGRIGYGVFNFFGYYSLSTVFEDDFGPDINPIIFGISLTSF